MALVTTPAVVLQTYRYSETSKVVRLATRELGVQSGIAKGALRPKSRFGAGLDPATFSVAAGGVACPTSAPAPPLTRLPRQAYRDLLVLNDAAADLPRLDAPHAAAHRRLVARFVRHHFGEAGALSALDFWERRAWSPPLTPPAPVPSAAS